MNRYDTKIKDKQQQRAGIEYFPRGKEDFEFNYTKIGSTSSTSFLSKKRKKDIEMPHMSSKAKEGDTIQIEAEGETSRVMVPHFKVGDLVLLAICEIRKDYMIANYTRNKKAMIHSSYCGIDSDDDFSFANYFRIGQFVSGAVVSPGNDLKLPSGHTNKKILVSIDPKIINTGMSIEKIVAGMDLYGQLLQDNKGEYTVDFRFENKGEEEDEQDEKDQGEDNEKATEENEDIEIEDEEEDKVKAKVSRKGNKAKVILIDNTDEEDNKMIFANKTVGSYYYFKVVKSHYNTKTKQREISVSLNLSKYKFTIKSLDFSMLRPGFYFKSNITRNLSNGIEVAFGGNIGSIFIDHLSTSTKTKNIFARVIHISTSKHITSLSTLPHIKHLQTESTNQKESMIGNSYKATISQLVFGKSYKISLLDPNDDNNEVMTAFLHNNNIVQKQNDEEYKEGDQIEKILVKEYNFFDDSPICTMKTDNDFLNWNTIHIGAFLPLCEIDRINNNEIIVKLNNFIEGKIPLEHLTDHPLAKIPKKFKKGMKINTRVFACDSKTKKLVLTMKDTLLDETVPLYQSAKDLKEGQDVYAVYVGNGLFEHSGNVIGRLIRFETMNEKDFKLGKLYKYKIYKVNKNSNKVYFTKDKEIWLPGIGDFDTFIKRNQILSNISMLLNTFEDSTIVNDIGNDNENRILKEGSVHNFTIVPIEKLIKILLKKKVDSKLIEENKEALLTEYLFAKYQSDGNGIYYAFIPKDLIADYFNDKLFKKLQLKEVTVQLLILYHNRESKILFGTMKQSLIKHKDDILHINPDIANIKDQQFEDNRLYYGYVNKTTTKGIMVQFYGRKKILMRPHSLNAEYAQGQTVICRYSNKKFFIDTNVYITYSNQDFINESNEIYDIYYNLLKEVKGEENEMKSIKGNVSKLNDYGAIISFKDNKSFESYSGVISNEHIVTDLAEGEENVFEVIDYDYSNDIIHLKQCTTTKPKQIKKDKQNAELELNEVHRITIEFIGKYYIRGNCKGNKIIIKSSLYNFSLLNTKIEFNTIKIGSAIETIITSYDKHTNSYLGNIPLELYSKLKGKGKSKGVVKGKLSECIGETITAKINGIKGNYMYLLIDKTSLGKMHISNYNGNIDYIKSLLSQKTNERKTSTESKSSVNNTSSDLIIKAKIVSIEQKGKLKIYGLTSVNNTDMDEDMIDTKNSNSALSKTIDLSGRTPNTGIISSIKKISNHPILISINSSKHNSNIKIPFSDIPIDQIAIDNELSNGGLQYKVGKVIQFYYNPSNKEYCLSQPITDKSLTQDTQNGVEIGKVYPIRILKSISGRGLVVDLNKINTESFVDICEITDSLVSNPLDFYPKGFITKGRVLSKDDKSNHYIISLRSSIVNDSDYKIITEASTLKFNQRFPVSTDLRNRIMKDGSKVVLDINTVGIGYITSSTEKGTFIKLASNVTVRVSMRELTDEQTATKPYLLFKENSLAICRIISLYKKDPNNIKYNASMRQSIIKYNLSLHTKDLSINNFYSCIVMNANDKGYEVNIIGSTFTGVLHSKSLLSNKGIKGGDIMILQLVKCDKESHPPKLEFSNKEIEDQSKFDMKLVINQLSKEEEMRCKENAELYNKIFEINEYAQKEKNIEDIIDITKGDNDIDYEELLKEKGVFATDKDGNDDDNDDDNDQDMSEIEDDMLLDDIDDKDVITNKEEKFALLSGVEHLSNKMTKEDELLVSKEDEDIRDEKEEEKESTNVLQQHDKKTSAAKREKIHLNQEMLIREKENNEEEIIDAASYEKKILNDPNNSINWIQYASYILDNLNLSSTRKIFERAIKAIDIAKTKEKLNIWVAYLNLENLYGTPEGFKSLIDRALEVNDKKSIYLHLISIYKHSNKIGMANEIFKLLTKESFNDFDVWKKYIEFLFTAKASKDKAEVEGEYNDDNNEIQTPKEGLNKAMQVMPKKKHLDLLLWYGQLLFAHNAFEEARNTFESILKNLPKRKDIWFVYADKELKHSKNIIKVRQIYDKMLSIEFKAKALKSVLAKYLKFEQENGTEKEFIAAQSKAQKIIGERMQIDQDEEGRDGEGEGEGNKEEDNSNDNDNE